MTVEQLLEVVAHAEVRGTTVKQMYETGQINEFGLRRVAIEFLRGKHFEKVLSVYLLPDSGEVMRSRLSPEAAIVGSAAGGHQTVSFRQVDSNHAVEPSRVEAANINIPAHHPKSLRKPPKIYPSAIGMALGAVLALVIIIYVLLKTI